MIEPSEISDFHLRYPIGPMPIAEIEGFHQIPAWIESIRLFPDKIIHFLDTNPAEIETCTYRVGSWTVKQVIHHCADSHINAMCRLKLGLTENMPIIKPYAEEEWAELSDSFDCPLSDSILLLTGLHHRWVKLLESMSESDFKREIFHPGSKEIMTLAQLTRLYAWHCDHHFGHLLLAAKNLPH